MRVKEKAISRKDVEKWIDKSNSLYCLQRIRSKVNKRIKYFNFRYEESPFRNIPTKEKREVLKSLFINDKEVEGLRRR